MGGGREPSAFSALSPWTAAIVDPGDRERRPRVGVADVAAAEDADPDRHCHSSPRPRQHRGERPRPVPQVLQAQVLVRRVLVVVVVRDGQADDRHGQDLEEEVHRHAAAQGRQADHGRPPRLSTAPRERARERRVQRRARRGIARVPRRAGPAGAWRTALVEGRRLVRRPCSPARAGAPRGARAPRRRLVGHQAEVDRGAGLDGDRVGRPLAHRARFAGRAGSRRAA